MELSGAAVAGRLSEPYRLLRLAVTAERDALGCLLRTGAEHEARTQSEAALANGRSTGVQWSSKCPVPNWHDWALGATMRVAVDQPVDPSRPGGTQRQQELSLNLQAPLPAHARLDASLRLNRVHDDEGYSPQLENGARRSLNQVYFAIEVTQPLTLAWLPSGAEALWQVQTIHQNSNLSVFRYSGFSTYAGLRWAW
jgi:hypothetical protein